MQEVVLIEDRQDIHEMVRSILCPTYKVHIAETYQAALDLSEKVKADLILLDINLPDGDGFELIPKLQNSKYFAQVPFIILTGRSEITDRVTGFSLGADDYIIKPFHPIEFKARVEAKLKARAQHSSTKNLLRFGDLEIDSLKMKVTKISPPQKELELTTHEYRLLTHLCQNSDLVFSRDQLLDAIWGETPNIMHRTIDRHISSIKKKLQGTHIKISSVRGVGYKITLLSPYK